MDNPQHTIRTAADLLAALQNLTPDQLALPVAVSTFDGNYGADITGVTVDLAGDVPRVWVAGV